MGGVPLFVVSSCAVKVLWRGEDAAYVGPLPCQLKHHPPGRPRPKEAPSIVVALTILNLTAVGFGNLRGFVVFGLLAG